MKPDKKAAEKWAMNALRDRPCPEKWYDLVKLWFPKAHLAGQRIGYTAAMDDIMKELIRSHPCETPRHSKHDRSHMGCQCKAVAEAYSKARQDIRVSLMDRTSLFKGKEAQK